MQQGNFQIELRSRLTPPVCLQSSLLASTPPWTKMATTTTPPFTSCFHLFRSSCCPHCGSHPHPHWQPESLTGCTQTTWPTMADICLRQVCALSPFMHCWAITLLTIGTPTLELGTQTSRTTTAQHALLSNKSAHHWHANAGAGNVNKQTHHCTACTVKQ